MCVPVDPLEPPIDEVLSEPLLPVALEVAVIELAELAVLPPVTPALDPEPEAEPVLEPVALVELLPLPVVPRAPVDALVTDCEVVPTVELSPDEPEPVEPLEELVHPLAKTRAAAITPANLDSQITWDIPSPRLRLRAREPRAAVWEHPSGKLASYSHKDMSDR